MKKISQLIIPLAILFLASCVPQMTPQQGDISTSSAKVIRVKDAIPQEMSLDGEIEEFRLPNCGGSSEVRQTLGNQATVSKSVEVGKTGSLSGSGSVEIPEAIRIEMEVAVEENYRETFTAANSRLDTIEMAAAPGTEIVYLITWHQQVYESTVQYVDGNRIYEAPYSYILRVPKIKGSYPVECAQSGANTLQSEPTKTPVSSYQSSPTSRPVSVLPRWDEEVSDVPSTGTKLRWDLDAGQLLFISGGQLRLNNTYCGGSEQQICVFIYTATSPQTVIIDALVPGNNYYGISSSLTPDEAIGEKEPQFWYPPNCTTGCQYATVFVFRDGQMVEKKTLTKP
ncbi:hypothetical protein D6779_08365 [Candidatus Parcubacteria bacterium]|nr:MAG: hypothetical protein D6779_08365 [Candidatus Parcubacteria bacterium]